MSAADCGLDGTLLTWVDYAAGMRQFNAEVLPRIERLGLRYIFCRTDILLPLNVAAQCAKARPKGSRPARLLT